MNTTRQHQPVKERNKTGTGQNVNDLFNIVLTLKGGFQIKLTQAIDGGGGGTVIKALMEPIGWVPIHRGAIEFEPGTPDAEQLAFLLTVATNYFQGTRH